MEVNGKRRKTIANSPKSRGLIVKEEKEREKEREKEKRVKDKEREKEKEREREREKTKEKEKKQKDKETRELEKKEVPPFPGIRLRKELEKKDDKEIITFGLPLSQDFFENENVNLMRKVALIDELGMNSQRQIHFENEPKSLVRSKSVMLGSQFSGPLARSKPKSKPTTPVQSPVAMKMLSNKSPSKTRSLVSPRRSPSSATKSLVSPRQSCKSPSRSPSKTPLSPRHSRRSPPRSPSRARPCKTRSALSVDPKKRKITASNQEFPPFRDEKGGKKGKAMKSTISRSSSFGTKNLSAIQTGNPQISSPKFGRKTKDVAILVQNDLVDWLGQSTESNLVNAPDGLELLVKNHVVSPPFESAPTKLSPFRSSPDGSPISPRNEKSSYNIISGSMPLSPSLLSLQNAAKSSFQDEKQIVAELEEIPEGRDAKEGGQQKRKKGIVRVRSMLKMKDGKNVQLVRNFVGPGEKSYIDVFQNITLEQPHVVDSPPGSPDGFSLEEESKPKKVAYFDDRTEDQTQLDLDDTQTDESFFLESQVEEVEKPESSRRKKIKFRANVISMLLEKRPSKDFLEEKTMIFGVDQQKKLENIKMLTEFFDHSLSSYSTATTEIDGDLSSEQSQVCLLSTSSCSGSLSLSRSSSRDSLSFSSSRDSLSHSTSRDSFCLHSRYQMSEEFWKTVDGKTMEFRSLDVQEQIGRGKYGRVYKAFYKGKPVAVKRVQLRSAKETETSLLREVYALRKAQECRYIVNLLGVCSTPCCIVMELWEGGSLYNRLHIEKEAFELSVGVRILLDIAEALRFLHYSITPSIIHRDVTTRNILLRKGVDRIEAGLADFGIATTAKKKGIPMSPIGRVRYMAPEVSQKIYTKRSDQFMYGHVIYEMVVQKKPFYGLGALEALKKAQAGQIPLIPPTAHPQLAQLMQQCWEFKPKSRPSFKEICRRLRAIKV